MENTKLQNTVTVTPDGKFELTVQTPGGNITAKSMGDKGYPDASICVNGVCVTFVEWHPDSKQFNCHCFNPDSDEPIGSFEDITGINQQNKMGV